MNHPPPLVAASCSCRPRQSVPVQVRPLRRIRLAAAAARRRRYFPAREPPFLSRPLCAPCICICICMQPPPVVAAAEARPHKAADAHRLLHHVPGASPPANTYRPSLLLLICPLLFVMCCRRPCLRSCSSVPQYSAMFASAALPPMPRAALPQQQAAIQQQVATQQQAAAKHRAAVCCAK